MSNALARFAERLNAAKARIPSPTVAAPTPAPPAETSPVTHVPSGRENPLADSGSAVKYRVTAAIPAGARVAGDLVLEESVILGGAVDGKLAISGKGMAAFIKQGAVVRGGIKATLVLVYGEVYGTIEAEYVRIYPGGRVEGAIEAESMMVDKGALLLNADMRVTPPITSAANVPIDARPLIRPASTADVRTLADAIDAVRRSAG